MKGYFEVNYNIYVSNKYINGNEGYYCFLKQSIIHPKLNKLQPNNIDIVDDFVFNTFYMLYPILKTIPKEFLSIQKAWDTWHPIGKNDEIKVNVYNEKNDKYYTNWFLAQFPENIKTIRQFNAAEILNNFLWKHDTKLKIDIDIDNNLKISDDTLLQFLIKFQSWQIEESKK